MNVLFFHCRAGFERECAQELAEVFADYHVELEIAAEENSAYVIATGNSADVRRIGDELHLHDLIFARQWFVAQLVELDPKNRVDTIVKALGNRCGVRLLLESPDSDPGRELAGLCRAIRAPLEQALKKQGLLKSDHRDQLHVCFLDGSTAYVGYVESSRASIEAMGIRRLRFPKKAPSRSTLKLEEAMIEFIPHEEHGTRFRPRMSAVDLGASPGGWTYQLVERGLNVIAVDNGPMDRDLMLTKQVEHLRADGFMYRPKKRVDWMVCDMVEKPARVADLLSKWLTQGWTKEAIVNFKLPMKNRYDDLMRCLDRVARELENHRFEFELRAKHLYHDREEVTVHVRVL